MTARARILLAEDEAIVAMDVERRLTVLGYEVVGSTRDADEAVSVATETRPDLVLMDIRLQGGSDGIDAARTIRERQLIPVVFLTAYGDEATVERAKASDPFGYLLKPFSEIDLRRTIELALERHAMERRLAESERALRESRLELLRATARAIQAAGAGEAVESVVAELTRRFPASGAHGLNEQELAALNEMTELLAQLLRERRAGSPETG